MSISCLIVDDEPKAVELLQTYINQVPFLKLQHTCYDAFEAIAYLHEHTVDLIFLDINMPDMSGMELVEVLPPKQQLIFTTAYSEYAIKSYEFKALDYLLKPISFKRFLMAVMRVPDAHTPKHDTMVEDHLTNDYFYTKTGKEVVKVEYRNIFLVKGLKSYILLQTDEDKIIIYKRLQEMEALLAGKNFLRVHHSYIVNLDKIRKVVDNHIYIGNEQIPISEKYREVFLSNLQRKFL